ncbi:MAG: L,D-transpeptidase family protein [Methylococcales bacterium]
MRDSSHRFSNLVPIVSIIDIFLCVFSKIFRELVVHSTHLAKKFWKGWIIMVRMNYSAFVTPFQWAIGLLVLLNLFSSAHADEEVWLLVDTKHRVISVKQGKDTKAEYNNISIGRNGAAPDKIRGDYKTPLGIYRIGWINPQSNFHRFYGVNYPSRMDAKRGLQNGLIDRGTYQRLFDADLLDRVPDQTTPLGGQIGIHGIGSADPEIHRTTNWTRGCIALTDSQLNSLGAWIKKGTVVVIR